MLHIYDPLEPKTIKEVFLEDGRPIYLVETTMGHGVCLNPEPTHRLVYRLKILTDPTYPQQDAISEIKQMAREAGFI